MITLYSELSDAKATSFLLPESLITCNNDVYLSNLKEQLQKDFKKLDIVTWNQEHK